MRRGMLTRLLLTSLAMEDVLVRREIRAVEIACLLAGFSLSFKVWFPRLRQITFTRVQAISVRQLCRLVTQARPSVWL